MIAPKKSQILTLAVMWLLAVSVWAPVNTLKHIESNQLLSGSVTVAHQESATANSECLMENCSDSMSHVSHCDISCQISMSLVAFAISPPNEIDLFALSNNLSYKALSLAVAERPPRHFV